MTKEEAKLEGEYIKEIYHRYGSCEDPYCITIDEYNNLVDRIYDTLEQQLKEKDKEIIRLRSQIARNHDVRCECSHCKG